MSKDAIKMVLEDCHYGAILPGVLAAQKAVLEHEQELLDGTRELVDVLAEVRQPFVEKFNEVVKQKGPDDPEVSILLDAMNYLKW